MKRVVQIIVLILIICNEAHSQWLSVGLQSGIGTYKMDGLKSINNNVVKSLPFDAEIVADFPPFFYFRPSVTARINAVSFGFNFMIQSTGSRVSSKDYSGEYCLDMIVNSFGPGLLGEVTLNPKGKMKLVGYASLGLLFSELKIKENFTVQEYQMIDGYSGYKAQSWFAEPGLSLTYPIEFMVVGVNAGYMMTFKSTQYSQESNKDAYLQDTESGEHVKPEWDGFRFGLSLGFSFN